jgi:hypothetical protein
MQTQAGLQIDSVTTASQQTGSSLEMCKQLNGGQAPHSPVQQQEVMPQVL